MKYVTVLLSLIATTIFGQEESSLYQEVEFEVEGEFRSFLQDPLFDGQESQFPSIAFRPSYYLEWRDGYESINFDGFFRLDRDPSRTHWDVRELYYQSVRGKWDFSFGLKKVFWGVIETNHLVDIINQTDQVESFDGEQKLGQPMAQVTLTTDNAGTFSVFYMPYQRRRTFAGEKGRLRFGTVIAEDELTYESSAEEWRQDLALRWSHYVGVSDIGVSYFYGTGREPLFAFTADGSINAFYPVIHQAGLDLQITQNAFLWKLESIYRHADIQDFLALSAGLEYTFSNINGKGLDIGALAEYHYDGRDELALTALESDVFVGSRVAFNDPNDTSILGGTIFDLDNGSKVYSIEASRRFGSLWTFNIEGRFLSSIAEDELILSNFRNDSFLKLSVVTYLF
ncbi:MAG: hypothetical protein AAFQ02_12765 [Bacteroidota bacterium]